MSYTYNGQVRSYQYMRGLKPGGGVGSCFLPGIGPVRNIRMKCSDAYPAPSPLRRSLSVLPWKPSIYYSLSSNVTSCLPSLSPPSPSRLIELDRPEAASLVSCAQHHLYARYTERDWKQSLCNELQDSNNMLRGMEQLKLDSNFFSETSEKLRKTTLAVGDRLDKRLGDIEFWENELKREFGNMVKENSEIAKLTSKIDQFLENCDNLLLLAQECLYHREKRQGIDLVHDSAEQALLKEVDTIKKCREMVRSHRHEIGDQMSLNRAALHELEKDAKDKHACFALDTKGKNLNENSSGLYFYKGIDKLDNTLSTPETWAEFTNNNINRSKDNRRASQSIQNDIISCLTVESEKLWKQWNEVNTQLTSRIADTMSARNQIQSQLSKVLKEVFEVEQHIELIKKEISDKIPTLKCAHTRLEIRYHRVNMEACRDAPQSRLVQQVNEINKSLGSLEERLRCAQANLQCLLRNKTMLEHDLAVKNNTLFLDRDKVMGLRKVFPAKHVC